MSRDFEARINEALEKARVSGRRLVFFTVFWLLLILAGTVASCYAYLQFDKAQKSIAELEEKARDSTQLIQHAKTALAQIEKATYTWNERLQTLDTEIASAKSQAKQIDEMVTKAKLVEELPKLGMLLKQSTEKWQAQLRLVRDELAKTNHETRVEVARLNERFSGGLAIQTTKGFLSVSADGKTVRLTDNPSKDWRLVTKP